MSTHILFEHPLNEKMRTWLRIEFYSGFTNICRLTIALAALQFLPHMVGDLADVD